MQKLTTKIVEKPWGRRGIDPRFEVAPDRQIGEIWFEPPPGRELDVMAKYLFTTERLSIQVHPDDRTARARGYPRGKDECWIVLDVAADAELGIGTVRELTPGEVMAAARDGSIVELMDWRKPAKGDFIFNPAGTIHALGPGLTVLEIQQAVDLTYRLYDYGRPRELHLDEAADVVRPQPHWNSLDTKVGNESRVLVDGPHFGVAWCVKSPPETACHVARRAAASYRCGSWRDQSGRMRPGRRRYGEEDLSSEGTFVLAWSTEPRSS